MQFVFSRKPGATSSSLATLLVSDGACCRCPRSMMAARSLRAVDRCPASRRALEHLDLRASDRCVAVAQSGSSPAGCSNIRIGATVESSFSVSAPAASDVTAVSSGVLPYQAGGAAAFTSAPASNPASRSSGGSRVAAAMKASRCGFKAPAEHPVVGRRAIAPREARSQRAPGEGLGIRPLYHRESHIAPTSEDRAASARAMSAGRSCARRSAPCFRPAGEARSRSCRR